MTSGVDLSVERTRSAPLIAEILRRDYFDAPVCYFPDRLIDAAARWVATSPSMYFINATAEGKSVGFVFGHSLGPALWKSFARSHPHLAPWLAWFLVARRRGEKRRDTADEESRARSSSPDLVSTFDIATIDSPFAWSEPDGETGYVDLLYVSWEFRGRGLGINLLQAGTCAMHADGVRRIEGHVDSGNYSSLVVFQRAGFQVARTSTGDFLCFLQLD